MIFSRSPLRISIAGGGTDLPSYYRNNEGFLISAAINKYVYVAISKPFRPEISLKYSKIEKVNHVSDIEHPIIRETLKIFVKKDEKPQIEINSIADLPSGTGLGSSGSFTTALITSLKAFNREIIYKSELAELACEIEINKLGESIGKQDQYISAYGGINCFSFHKNDTVTVHSLDISHQTLLELEENLLLFFTGFSRQASSILKDQKNKTESFDKEMISNLDYVKEMGFRAKQLLVEGKTHEYGKLLHEHWENKKRRSKGMSNPLINKWYEVGLKNGAMGGKLVGAGGGGFLLFYTLNKTKLRAAMSQEGLEEVHFNFDFEGAKIINS